MDYFETFLEQVMDRGIELYPAQEEAVLELYTGNHVILATPTGSGKSLVAEAMHYRAVREGTRSYYTSPIKALVSEKFFSLCESLGAENVGMLTGDAAINRDAPVVCCTAEVLANIALREGEDADVDSVCMDEFHYYADPDRGMAWQIPLLLLKRAQFLLMSATLGDTTNIEESLMELTGRDVSVVSSAQRPVPLEFEYCEQGVTYTLHDLVEQNRAPIYVVNFSQREAAEHAQAQMSLNFCNKAEKQAIGEAIKGFRWTSPYGKEMQRYIRHGIGLHHAGLLPKYRLLVERLAQQGLLKIINGTDTLGVGVNVPIRTVLFTKLCKFDGTQVRQLSVREFKQIGGRAGRKGYDDKGWVACQAPEHVIENRKLEARARNQGKKKFTRKKPPTRGYVPWNKDTFEKLIEGQAEPLESIFQVDMGMLLNMLQRTEHNGYRALMQLIAKAHIHDGKKSHLRRETRQLFKALLGAGIVEVWREDGRSEVTVAEGLQHTFSMHHTLSLFLVDALDALEEHVDDEYYPFRVLTLVECILENPRGVLMRQLDREKGALINALKAEGVPYEERIEKLEEVTWPRPDKDWIWTQFDSFTEKHPWVKTEQIRVKSIAREMVERWCTFDDYVRDLGAQRMEGVLLRYLTQVYKTLVQNVPDDTKTDAIIDIEAYLRTLLARVDSSLVLEWEKMNLEAEALDLGQPIRAPRLEDDMRAFRARVRAELHLLVKCLSQEDFEGCVAGDRGDWSEERFEEALTPFTEEYGRLVFDHTARYTDKTVMKPAGDRCWEVTQILVDPEGDNLWCVEAVVDMHAVGTEVDLPLIEVTRIGA